MSDGTVEHKSASNDLKHQYVIKLPLRENGFCRQLAIIHIFHAKLGIEPRRGKSCAEDPLDCINWSFADVSHAIAFRVLFGGQFVYPPYASLVPRKQRRASKDE
jgi:hypothetical protein